MPHAGALCAVHAEYYGSTTTLSHDADNTNRSECDDYRSTKESSQAAIFSCTAPSLHFNLRCRARAKKDKLCCRPLNTSYRLSPTQHQSGVVLSCPQQRCTCCCMRRACSACAVLPLQLAHWQWCRRAVICGEVLLRGFALAQDTSSPAGIQPPLPPVS